MKFSDDVNDVSFWVGLFFPNFSWKEFLIRFIPITLFFLLVGIGLIIGNELFTAIGIGISLLSSIVWHVRENFRKRNNLV